MRLQKGILIPQELKRHALKKSEFLITKNALKTLIDEYTREAGVRNLRQKIASVMRKVAKQILENPKLTTVKITKKSLLKYVDKKIFEFLSVKGEPQVGIVNGLAWTSVGGDVLTIEAIKIKVKEIWF